jgi:hypothetical protein
MTQTLKKSSGIDTPIQGNSVKCLAYREAYTRITQAQEQGFYLEAITIEESIISDRLSSYFRNVLEETKPFSTLKRMEDYWRKSQPEAIVSKNHSDLIAALSEWRKCRNEAIHAIVQDNPNPENSGDTQGIEIFLNRSKDTAARGEELAKEIAQWCDKRIKEAKKNSGNLN